MMNFELKKYKKKVKKINKMEDVLSRLSDEELKQKTDEFRLKLKGGATKDSILVEAFATVREMSKRVLGMRHYDVQLIGGMVLHDGKVAEMKTGEGKTLVATLPTYLNALDEKGVHVVTTNEYLAQRDKELNEPLFNALGLTVGVVLSSMSSAQKRSEYLKDITYVTNSELGFDYLRDNRVYRISDRVLRGLNYAIVDEVDSILIDDARTPLIISEKGEKPSSLFKIVDMFVKSLSDEDFTMERMTESISLSDSGVAKAEALFNMNNYSDKEYSDLRHIILQSLKANHYFVKDDRYIVRDGEIVLIDSSTGRIAEGRRYSDGLHQAIEAKEGLEIKEDSKTLATITYQNFFTMYGKLSGMSGTVMTEIDEFRETYRLDVVEIPPNLPVIRKDLPDRIYYTEHGKIKGIVEEVKDSYKNGQPVLIGTESITKSEEISILLQAENIPHTVLNAKNHEQEAEIISKAGEKGAVTISTNMAGRGTDIKLDEGALDAGGLKVIGAYRNENRRIDNQLRGRSGRQGDPGSSQFFVSLEDSMIKTFISEKSREYIYKLGYDEESYIDDKVVSKAIENSQRKLEGRNYDSRKYVKKYDDAINNQRVHVYGERDVLISEEPILDSIPDVIREIISSFIDLRFSDIFEKAKIEEFDKVCKDFKKEIKNESGIDLVMDMMYGAPTLKTYNVFKEYCINIMLENYESKRNSENFDSIVKAIFLKNMDKLWIEHLDDVTALRKNMQFASLKQQDPLPEYIMETNKLYEDFMFTLKLDSIFEIMKYRVAEKQIADSTDLDINNLKVNIVKKELVHNGNISYESGIVYLSSSNKKDR